MTEPQDDPSRRQVAYHEAGHAVVAHSFGLIVESLRISDEPDPEFGWYGQAGSTDNSHLSSFDRITIYMAGRIGAELGGHPHSSKDCQELKSDLDKAIKTAVPFLRNPVTDDDVSDEDIERLFDRAAKEAEKIILARKALFHRLAKELFQRGSLTSADIEQILTKSM